MKLNIIAISSVILVGCASATIDNFNLDRVKRGELVLVQTDNDHQYGDFVFDRLFSAISGSSDSSRLTVYIEQVDGITTVKEFLDGNQMMAITPGHHILSLKCDHDQDFEKRESISNTNTEKLSMKFQIGIHYVVGTERDGDSCKFIIKETENL